MNAGLIVCNTVAGVAMHALN